ncbi:SPFH domain-containing protein, partial [bacterium]|nr:SPFH domain-containing protein [bacterium]
MALVVAILVITAMSYNLLLAYVGPSEYGIKQVKIGINRGIQEKVYTTGLHLVLPGMEVMHTFP